VIPKLETFQTERPGWTVDYRVHKGSPQVTVRNDYKAILYRTSGHSREQVLDAAKLYLKSRGVGFEWSA
jgi:hypothetical protein